MALNKKLHRLSNASASTRDENMFNVFSKLNTTQPGFLPGTITFVTTSSNQTIFSYLSDFIQAQLLEDNPNKELFLKYLQTPLKEHFYYQVIPESKKELAEELRSKWLKDYPKKAKNVNESTHGRLQQFILIPNKKNDLNTLYCRLVWSALTFKMLPKK